MKSYITSHRDTTKYYSTWLLALPPAANLLFMHYYFYFSNLLETPFMYSYIANLASVIFDVSVLLFIFSLLCRGQLKGAYGLTQATTLIWAFVNVFYSRFFFQYLPLSAIGSAGGLGDSTTISAMTDGFMIWDLYFLVSIVVFSVIYRKVPQIHTGIKSCTRLIIPALIALIITIATISGYFFIQPRYRSNIPLFKIHMKGALYDITCCAMPNLSHFQAGCIRVLFYEACDILIPRTLTDEERLSIAEHSKPTEKRQTGHTRPENIQNVIIILLESMLSDPIGLNIDGKEITPFLNALQADTTVFYNEKVLSDITCGESGDGQFIVLNGLLPLRYKTTVGSVKNNTLPAIPRLLEKHMGISNSTIIIPTKPSMWQQSDVNGAYGIKKMFSQKDIESSEQTADIDDADIFNFSARKLNTAEQPFFHLILSLSTHAPYDHYVGKDIFQGNTEYPREYLNYLCSCHYLDEQLRKYVDTLKSKGLYDKTLIIITADHFAHINRLKMDGRIKPYTPVFIIGGNVSRSNVWNGECHQLDIYTTITDILSINERWRGLGHTLLSPDYSNSVTSDVYDISELIINGNYFAE